MAGVLAGVLAGWVRLHVVGEGGCMGGASAAGGGPAELASPSTCPLAGPSASSPLGPGPSTLFHASPPPCRPQP